MMDLNKNHSMLLLSLVAISLFLSMASQAARTVKTPSIDVEKLIPTKVVATTPEKRALIEKTLQSRYETEEFDPTTYALYESIPVNLNLQESGAKYELADGRIVRSLRLSSPGANNVMLRIDYHIPEDGQILVYGGNN